MKRALALSPAARVQLTLYRCLAAMCRATFALWSACAALTGERRPVLDERLGRWSGPISAGRDVVWLHAASVGEVGVARVLVERLRRERPTAHLLLTCNTPTGRAAALEAGVDEVRYFPLDHPAVVAGVVARAEPSLFVFVETEIWPALLLELAARGVATVMVNACVSARSFSRYRRVRALIGAALGGVSLVCGRDEESLQRLLSLGVDPARALVVGDLKFDGVGPDEVEGAGDLLAGLTGADAVLLAASTHAGEDEQVLAAFDRVCAEHGASRLVLAPRHPQRSAAVLELARSGSRTAVAWSELARSRSADWRVLVVDSTGELRGFMRSSVGAFVGGTLVDVGGHSLVEPSAFGLPTVAGPHLGGVADQADGLRACDALTVVDDAEGLAGCWQRWLADAPAAAAAGRRARAFVEGHRGALDRTLDAMRPLLPGRAGDGAQVEHRDDRRGNIGVAR